MALTFIVAFTAGAISAIVESLHRRRLIWVSSDPRSVGVLVLAILAEGAVGCGIALGLRETTDMAPVATGLLAGAGVSTLLRQRFASGTDWGIARIYDGFERWVDRVLEQRSAQRSSAWLAGEVMPMFLARHQLDQFAARLRVYVTEIYRANKARKLKEIKQIDQKSTDPDATEEKKLEALIKLAQDLDALGVVKDHHRFLTGEDARPSRRRRALIVVTTAAAVLVAGGGALTLVLLDPFDDEPKIPKAEAPNPLRIAQRLYHVKLIETATTIGASRADGIYVLVKLVVGNESLRHTPVRASNFSIRTEGGEIQKPVEPKALSEKLWATPLEPEERRTGLLVFDVKRDELENLELTVPAPAPSNGESPDKPAGLVALGLDSDSPNLRPKVFHGKSGRGLRISFETTTSLVRRIVITGRRGRACRPTGTARVGQDGNFSYEDSNGLVVRGKFVSSLEASGEISQRVGQRRARCLSRRARSAWSARAAP